jgi:hypothetical protein
MTSMEPLDALDHIAINDVLCRFFLAFDERDWTAMESCLAPEVFVDYASSGRGQPSTVSGAEFVQRRRDAVDTLSKHHSFSNFYHSCGAYEFLFGKAEGAWKITSITQRALQSWGNRQLHAGTRKAEA